MGLEYVCGSVPVLPLGRREMGRGGGVWSGHVALSFYENRVTK